MKGSTPVAPQTRELLLCFCLLNDCVCLQMYLTVVQEEKENFGIILLKYLFFWAFSLEVDCKVDCKVLPLLHCFHLAHFILM